MIWDLGFWGLYNTIADKLWSLPLRRAYVDFVVVGGMPLAKPMPDLIAATQVQEKSAAFKTTAVQSKVNPLLS